MGACSLGSRRLRCRVTHCRQGENDNGAVHGGMVSVDIRESKEAANSSFKSETRFPGEAVFLLEPPTLIP